MGVLAVDTGGGGDYTSLIDAWAALAAMPNLTEDWQIICSSSDGAVDDGEMNASLPNNPDGHTITIESDPAYRHGGVWDDAKYRLYVEGLGVQLTSPFVVLRGILIAAGGTGYNCHAVNLKADDLLVDACVIRYEGSENDSAIGITTDGKNRTWARNCIVYGGFKTGFSIGGDPDLSGAENCTAVGCVDVSFKSEGYQSGVFRNCISSGIVSDRGFKNASPNCSNNIAEDDSGDIQGVVTFRDAAAHDYHLAETDTIAIGAGVDLSATFTDDIDGETRTAPWDIGADEFVVPYAGPTFVQSGGGHDAGENYPGTVTVAMPAPPTAGNGLLAVVFCDDVITPPAGWTKIFEDASGRDLAVFSHIAEAGDPSDIIFTSDATYSEMTAHVVELLGASSEQSDYHYGHDAPPSPSAGSIPLPIVTTPAVDHFLFSVVYESFCTDYGEPAGWSLLQNPVGTTASGGLKFSGGGDTPAGNWTQKNEDWSDGGGCLVIAVAAGGGGPTPPNADADLVFPRLTVPDATAETGTPPPQEAPADLVFPKLAVPEATATAGEVPGIADPKVVPAAVTVPEATAEVGTPPPQEAPADTVPAAIFIPEPSVIVGEPPQDADPGMIHPHVEVMPPDVTAGLPPQEALADAVLPKLSIPAAVAFRQDPVPPADAELVAMAVRIPVAVAFREGGTYIPAGEPDHYVPLPQPTDRYHPLESPTDDYRIGDRR